ncbi:c-type cytochrome, partial [Bacillus sp. D-CC]
DHRGSSYSFASQYPPAWMLFVLASRHFLHQLQGAVGPNLQKIGGKLSKDEIKEILSKGKGNMPANIVPADQAAKVADWLSKKK